jgi:hypothetical protein
MPPPATSGCPAPDRPLVATALFAALSRCCGKILPNERRQAEGRVHNSQECCCVVGSLDVVELIAAPAASVNEL